jgi:hypothetical protein
MGELKDVFNPENVAVVGATEKEGSIPRIVLGNLLSSFKGNFSPSTRGGRKSLALSVTLPWPSSRHGSTWRSYPR